MREGTEDRNGEENWYGASRMGNYGEYGKLGGVWEVERILENGRTSGRTLVGLGKELPIFLSEFFSSGMSCEITT